MDMTDTCHECGDEYERIAQHWALSDCNHQPFSECQHEVLTGLLMGDGGITWSGRRKAPQMQVKMIEENYLNYLSSDIFPILSGGVSIDMTAEEHAYSQRKHGGNPNAKTKNYNDSFNFCIMTHPGLIEYGKWYQNGGKTFPEDIELTPTTLKHYFVGDGHFNAHGNVKIGLSNERENRDKIINMFRRAGFEDFAWDRYERGGDYKDGARVRFRKEGTKWFFRYIGDPLPGFEYKWPEHKR